MCCFGILKKLNMKRGLINKNYITHLAEIEELLRIEKEILFYFKFLEMQMNCSKLKR